MLLVPTVVRTSTIHGLGCFALKPIKKGTEVWEFSLIFDTLIEVYIAENAFDALQYEFLTTYAYTDGEYLLMSGDQSKYINHSKTPNIGDEPGEVKGEDEGTIFDTRFALRDIAAGEELTEFYFMEEEDDDDEDAA